MKRNNRNRTQNPSQRTAILLLTTNRFESYVYRDKISFTNILNDWHLCYEALSIRIEYIFFKFQMLIPLVDVISQFCCRKFSGAN